MALPSYSQSSVGIYPTYSTTDLISLQSSAKIPTLSTTSLFTRFRPVIDSTPTTESTVVDPKANLELTYPSLHKFVNHQLDWDAPLQLLKVTLKIINDKRVFRKKTDAAQFEDLKQLYRDWWILIRNNPTLQNANVRKLSKFIKDFIVAALEDASYAVKMAVLGTERLARLSVRESSVGSWRSDADKKPMQRPSSLISQVTSITDGPTAEFSKTDLMLAPSSSGKVHPVDIKSTPAQSRVGLLSSQVQFLGEGSVDMFSTAMKSMVNEDEVYMQIIVKDILSDISAREAERQKKLLQASDEAARGHRSSATTGEHPRVPFGSKRMSGKTIKSRVPLHAIKTSKIIGSLMDNMHSVGQHHSTGFGFGNALEASFLRSELKEKIKNIKHRNDRPDIAPVEGVKSLKEKVHMKIRANGAGKVQNYVRPLGKK